MRRTPMLRVEVSGQVVCRQAVPLHLYDKTGRIVVTSLRPQLEQGEILQERLGTFPAIIREVA